jgi:flagellar biosynthesis/type III secretory pathway protein FliH
VRPEKAVCEPSLEISQSPEAGRLESEERQERNEVKSAQRQRHDQIGGRAHGAADGASQGQRPVGRVGRRRHGRATIVTSPLPLSA